LVLVAQIQLKHCVSISHSSGRPDAKALWLHGGAASAVAAENYARTPPRVCSAMLSAGPWNFSTSAAFARIFAAACPNCFATRCSVLVCWIFIVEWCLLHFRRE
jgi:hypothetical protein